VNTDGQLQPDRLNQILPTLLIAQGCHASLESVAASWPLIVKALQDAGINSPLVQVAVAATVAVETGRSFKPIKEKMANPHLQPELYARQMQYFPWIGRGFVQITWESNYRLFGSLIGVDLVSNREAACEPETAAKVLAAFFHRNGIDKAANAKDWSAVRGLVNAGHKVDHPERLRGWNEFNGYVLALLESIGE